MPCFGLCATSHPQFEFDALAGCCAGEQARCPRQDDVVEREKEKRRGWVSTHMHTLPVRTTMHAGCAPTTEGTIGTLQLALLRGGGYSVTKFMIGDSLVFDFGDTQAVQDYFRQVSGVKAHPWLWRAGCR